MKNKIDIPSLNETAAFNRWCGFRVLDAGEGQASIEMAWREEVGQYSGFLHAGVVSALVDTACGYAAATLSGNVLAAHCAVSYLRPATGSKFVARAKVTKPGRTTIFAKCEVFAIDASGEKLVATGETILTVPVQNSGRENNATGG